MLTAETSITLGGVASLTRRAVHETQSRGGASCLGRRRRWRGELQQSAISATELRARRFIAKPYQQSVSRVPKTVPSRPVHGMTCN